MTMSERSTAAPPISDPADTSSDGLAKGYEPSRIEVHWAGEWERRGYYRAGLNPDKPAFSIQLPPPNVTGRLHMGHAFNHTIMDALTRFHRMRGFNALWLPGTDHAGIATQIVVERQLEQAGVDRKMIGRDKFIEQVWDWKHDSGGTILQQMRRLGDSCDFAREYFTMDEDLSRVVTETFVRLYEQGLIYRGKRLVNWDPKLQRAVSDLEVESEEEDGRLWEIRYPAVVGAHDSGVVVATSPPQTVQGDGTERTIPIAQFYRAPAHTPHLDTVLGKGELITSVTLPKPVEGAHIYRKVRDRASNAFALVSIAAVLCAVAACGATTVTIKGSSMSPAFKDGDTAIGVRNVDPIARGDVIGFRYPRDETKNFIQRVIGLPGEDIEIANGRVAINGRPIEEPYVLPANDVPFSLSRRRIADGEYFVMGDNRVNSSDSRSWGTVTRAAIWLKVATK